LTETDLIVTGIEENERADTSATQATSDQTIETLYIFSKYDLKREAKKCIVNTWRMECKLTRR